MLAVSELIDAFDDLGKELVQTGELDPGRLPIGRPHRVGVTRSANRAVDRCLADLGIEGRVSERRRDKLH